jgi:DNA-binding response OmpR family regulator
MAGLRIMAAEHVLVVEDDEPIAELIVHNLSREDGVTRSQIVEAVRGGNFRVTDRAVDVAVFGLRKKLGLLGGLVETVRGVGYRLREGEPASAHEGSSPETRRGKVKP